MSEWIDVKYRPKQRGEYLVFQPEQIAMGVKVEARRTVARWTGAKWMSSLTVTHWMLLPDPPANLQDTAEPVKHDG